MRHAMTYTIAGGDTFNMVLSHPELEDPESWDQSKAIESMKDHFNGWDPRYDNCGDSRSSVDRRNVVCLDSLA